MLLKLSLMEDQFPHKSTVQYAIPHLGFRMLSSKVCTYLSMNHNNAWTSFDHTQRSTSLR